MEPLSVFGIVATILSAIGATVQVVDYLEKRLQKPQNSSDDSGSSTSESPNQSSASELFYNPKPPKGWKEAIETSFTEAVNKFKKQGIQNHKDCKTILIVDDEKIIRDNLRELLEWEGYNVLLAGTAESAFKILDRETPDLILCDVVLPKANGYSFTRNVREISLASWVPIILMSAIRQESLDRLTGLEAGAIDYINKPFTHEELTAKIRAVLKQVDLLINKK